MTELEASNPTTKQSPPAKSPILGEESRSPSMSSSIAHAVRDESLSLSLSVPFELMLMLFAEDLRNEGITERSPSPEGADIKQEERHIQEMEKEFACASLIGTLSFDGCDGMSTRD
jgi:hypothetical protein